MGKTYVGPDGKRIALDVDGAMARAAARPVRHFTPTTGPQVDATGRLWVFGQAHDSTFVDLFHDRRFIRRWMFPCWNPWPSASIDAAWFLLVCEATSEEGDAVASLQLYRIRADTGRASDVATGSAGQAILMPAAARP
jgi:hypothetical protein